MSGLLDNRRWDILPSNGKAERLLCEELGLDPLVARVLSARGIGTVAEARRFLEPSLERDWVDPLKVPGMREAADRVEAAIDAGERIAVFGDFDVDGMTSTCLLTQALRSFGAEVHPYIPHRFGEGYGLSRAALDRVLGDSHPDLIITVDNGIAAQVEVAWLLKHGVDVVITDHHEPGDLVPKGVPVTDPKLSEDCPSRELAGVGVALKLVCELGRRRGQGDAWKEYVDLAALGTVSDMMLLQGENRSLVFAGIRRMQQSHRPGIVALAATAGIDLTSLHADELPFSLIPRLNAAGRMGTTEVAFDLLISDDPSEAAVLAGMLERTNTDRRETESALSNEALDVIARTYDGERVIVCGGAGWHEGVKGIVASRIVSRYHVPAIVFSIGDGVARGSGRSVGSVDLFHAVEQCSDLLVRFGGHAGAVGVTCEVDKLDAFKRRLQEVMAKLPEEQFVDKGVVSAIVSLSEFSRQSIAALDSLQPFGQGNKRPLFGIQGVFMRNRARVGYEGSHLRFLATDGAASVPAIMFRAPNMERAYACDGIVDLVVDAVNESWQGRVNPKLMVSDIVFRDAAESGGAAGAATTLARADAGVERPEEAQLRERLSKLSYDDLTDVLRKQMIGNNELLPAQKAALSVLEQGRSPLCVMATGWGKSLIFHIHAARTALLRKQTSIFVYPLRALVSDQAFCLGESLGKLGLSVCVLTGETSAAERDRVYAGMEKGTVDVILTTPEFLAINTRHLARSRRIGFLVIDEAHHAGPGHGGRSAYGELPRILDELGHPVSLAVTATASAPVAQEICRLLGIREGDVVIDRSMRPNLTIQDHRDLRDRDMLLTSLVATGQKTVVYVNSRQRAELLTRMLRSGIPELGHAISYYHAGMSRADRLRAEQAFRDGRLCCVVSTSAFGEGVNIPDIRNVVLYHMPFCATEFNQMSGRAGRDGKSATIHMLFGSRDARINEGILVGTAPSRDNLVTLYRTLVAKARETQDNMVALSNEELLDVSSLRDGHDMSVGSVGVAIGVFEELGFLEVRGYDDGRMLHMVPSPEHVSLESSILYAEGLHAQEEFRTFRDWALSSLAQEMLSRVNRPITPGFGHTVDR